MGNSAIIERWWLVTFASFTVVFLLFLNHSPGSNNISLLQNVTVPINTASNGFPVPNMQSPMAPIVIEDEKIRPCIPLTETPSSQVPSVALQDEIPATGSSQTPAGPTWQTSNSNPSDFTQKVEPEPALQDGKPVTGSLQTPSGSTWQNSNSNPSDFTQKVEPEPALQDEKPATGSSQTPAGSAWQTSNSNPSDFTLKVEPEPALQDEKPATGSSQTPAGSSWQNSNLNPSDFSHFTQKVEPEAALQDAKPATGSFQIPAGLAWQNSNSNPSDFTQKQEHEPAIPDLSDSEKQATTLNDKIEVRTESSSPVPMVEGKNQEQSKYNVDDEEPVTMEEGKNCNIFEGKWIYDAIESPLYDSAMCPFFSDTTSCRRNGRPDKQYENWRWEANDCKIPRFNAKDMLERLRGKRVVIVGDSINHSQFESLSCLLYSAIPDQSYVDTRYRVFKAESYDLVIEFHWAQFLVEVVVNKTDGKKTLKLESVDPNAKKWKDADIMVFNTGHWWTSRLRWDLIRYKRNVFEDMKIETAFKVAMKTWARWVERNVNTSKTTVYFRGMSPAHFGKNWCYKSTRPYTDVPSDLKFGETLKEIVEKTLGRMRTPVTYLNITQLSAYRVDAHSSIYAKKDGQLLIATKQKPPAMVADCSHWCLPGVPDTWNHLLYASMVLDRSKGISNV